VTSQVSEFPACQRIRESPSERQIPCGSFETGIPADVMTEQPGHSRHNARLVWPGPAYRPRRPRASTEAPQQWRPIKNYNNIFIWPETWWRSSTNRSLSTARFDTVSLISVMSDTVSNRAADKLLFVLLRHQVSGQMKILL